MLFDLDKKDTLIIIPARGGSQRVPNKNLRMLNNQPLIVHSIRECLKIKNAITIVSTDSQNIAEISSQNGAIIPFIRPKNLSKSNSSSRSVIIHSLNYFYKTYNKLPLMVALKPPTNPFIKSNSIQEIIKKLKNSNDKINSCVSITEANTHPFRIISFEKDSRIQNGVFSVGNQTINDIERSQDWPKCWEGSPAFRLTKTKYFADEVFDNNFDVFGKTYDYKNSIGFEISNFEAFDIDVEFDLKIAQSLASMDKMNISA